MGRHLYSFKQLQEWGLRIFFPIFFVLPLILLLSCENKFFAPNEDISDDDIDVIPDGDSDVIPDDDPETEVLTNLKVEKNKKNSLSCRLTFSTADEKKTFVKYYSGSHSGYKIAEKEEKNDHYFFLWGMRENLDYTIEIYSDEETPELLATTFFHSGFVPESVYPVHLVANEKESVMRGFVLFSQVVESGSPYASIVMVDNDGFPVWYYEYDVSGFSDLEDPAFIEQNNHIFVGVHKYPTMAEIPAEDGIEIDLEGNIVWKSPDIAGYYYSETGWHHDYKLLDDGTILFIHAEYSENLLTDRILNVDREYNELWNWGYLDSPGYFNEISCTDPNDEWCDWTHTNSVFTDSEKRFLYFNARCLGFYKMEMETKEIVWKFGEDGDFTMLSDHIYPWPDYPHDPKIREDGKAVLFYDNAWSERNYSRVIEYIFDEDLMTAEISFEFDGFSDERGWFAPAWGDADYLENGNIFVTKGMVNPPENSSLFELTRDGRVVWELYTEQNDEYNIIVYNADKFVPPLEFLDE